MDSKKDIKKIYLLFNVLFRKEQSTKILQNINEYLELFKKLKLLRRFGYKFIWHRIDLVTFLSAKTVRIHKIFSLDAVDDLMQYSCTIVLKRVSSYTTQTDIIF